ncbi:MAG: hypothetical protein K6E71_00550 [Lachnospiraceae bacterium]|nr:hypothetical protein [Lachnospiraceae bacterium]
MNIKDTSPGVLSAFDSGRFSLEQWKMYVDDWVPDVKELCLQDMKECLQSGFLWDADFLPVLNNVAADSAGREETVRLFRAVTGQLEEKITERFHRSVDADVVLYLGLCNGAGWVVRIGGRTTVLLGIEKIMELNWCNENDMNGLILHELGHVFQAQHGLFELNTANSSDRFLWQLFTEGVAMFFEQEIVENPEYYHQDRNGWRDWCERNLAGIAGAFAEDMHSMTRENQRYFGDWVDYEGRTDVGYYLGTRFVRFLAETESFENVIRYDIENVREGYDRFCRYVAGKDEENARL